MEWRRPAFVLPVVLVMIGLLALVMAGFTFFVRAEVTGAEARRDAHQARLTAESGLQEVITVLRQAQNDPSQWWDVPDVFRHALVWSPDYDREHDPIREGTLREDLLEETPVSPAWRFSVVAPRYDGVEETFRYGITPEAGKLNVNAASEEEIRRLMEDVLLGLQMEQWPELVDALLDWIDEDDEPRPLGAESDYYNTLAVGYYPKNGPLDTVEELLLVKGFSAAVLYGEDVNRNNLLDLNEDDGDASFPYYDNADGILQQGLAPYLTVWSQQPGAEGKNVAGRVNVNTAPLRVLRVLDGMTPEGAEQIIALRNELTPEALLEADWPQTSGALDAATFDAVKDGLTVEALQFHVEIVGYADHVRLAQRHEWIIEMRGPIAQVLYHRDLTKLGFAWPVNDETIVVESE